jgi:hypothetical protein
MNMTGTPRLLVAAAVLTAVRGPGIIDVHESSSRKALVVR